MVHEYRDYYEFSPTLLLEQIKAQQKTNRFIQKYPNLKKTISTCQKNYNLAPTEILEQIKAQQKIDEFIEKQKSVELERIIDTCQGHILMPTEILEEIKAFKEIQKLIKSDPMLRQIIKEHYIRGSITSLSGRSQRKILEMLKKLK